MKQIILTFLLSLFSINCFSQITLSQEQLDSLPPAVKLAVETSDAKQKAKNQLETVSEYAGLGREIGEAVNGALGAVEDHVLSISESDLGKTAIFIVCWKLLFKDIIGLFIGLVLLTLMTVFMFRFFRLIKSKEFIENSESTQSTITGLWFLAFAVLFISSMFAIFG